MDHLASTPRLSLRLWTLADTEAALALWGDPEVMRFVESPLTPDQAHRTIIAGQRVWEAHGVQHFAVCLAQGGEIIGCSGFNPFSEPETLEFVTHFMPHAWGKGYAQEAGEAALDWARQTHPSKGIIASTHQANVHAQGLLRRLGFKQEGERFWEDVQAYEPFFRLPQAPPGAPSTGR